ncbi:MAG: transposase, partial [Pikeienuella sp.]
TLRLATNDLDAPAEEIAALYKRRWDIELFFKWIKQNLKIRHFLGTSQNATAIQIYVALIAYLLIQMAKSKQLVVKSLQAYARLIRLNIMHRRCISAIAKLEQHPPPDKRQTEMELGKY